MILILLTFSVSSSYFIDGSLHLHHPVVHDHFNNPLHLPHLHFIRQLWRKGVKNSEAYTFEVIRRRLLLLLSAAEVLRRLLVNENIASLTAICRVIYSWLAIP
jgi:hypothetical protein